MSVVFLWYELSSCGYDHVILCALIHAAQSYGGILAGLKNLCDYFSHFCLAIFILCSLEKLDKMGKICVILSLRLSPVRIDIPL